MRLMMADTLLNEGDLFHLHFTIGPRNSATEVDAYVLLDVSGHYWFWPDWISADEGLDYEHYSLAPGEKISADVLRFTWPGIEGSGSALFFYGAAFHRNTYDLVGEIQAVGFAYE